MLQFYIPEIKGAEQVYKHTTKYSQVLQNSNSILCN